MEERVKRPSNPVLAIIFVLVFSALGSSSATNVYITPNGASQGNCTTGPQTPAWFNSSANWGSGTSQIGPGTSVLLCGTITTPLTVQSSGSGGNPITITFDTGAAINPISCSSGTGNACLSVAGRAYIIVDGGTTCGWINHAQVACNGTIQNSTAQPSGSNFGIDASNCTNCEFRNLNIGPIYTKSSGGTEPSGDIRGIQAVSSAGTGTWQIHNNIAHDTSSAFVYVPSGSNDPGPTVYNNVTYNINSSLDISNNSNGTLIAAVVHDNNFGSTANWDNSGCPDHHNSMHAFAQGTGSNSGFQYYNNLINGNWGGCATSGLYFEGPSGTILVYNNVWLMTYTQMNNGIVGFDGASFAATMRFYNNTLIGQSRSGDVCMTLGSGSSATSISMENNIISGCNSLFAGQGSAITFTKVDYNTWGGDSSSTPWGLNCNPGPCSYYNFSGWQTAVSGEAHSTFGSSSSFVGVDSNGTLQSGSPAIGAVTNLTDVEVTALDSDMVGNPRPGGSTAWDGGAFNHSSSGAPPVPTSLTAVVH
jgi:hypothetical protein